MINLYSKTVTRYALFASIVCASVYAKDSALNSAINAGKDLIDTYLQNASAASKTNVKEYLNYYRSWYQSVTPAPATLQSSIDNDAQAKKFIEDLKAIPARYNLTKSKGSLMGASKLSWDGEDFYKKMVEVFKEQTKAQ